MNDIKKGALYALVCYLIWGVFPLFWYPLNQSDMPSIQILAQRIVWSAVFAGVLLTVFRQSPSPLCWWPLTGWCICGRF